MSDTPGYVKNLKKESVVQSVINCLTDAMRNKQLKPGDRIPPEPELAASMGVARSSVREAIKILTYLGVLESKRSEGTFVCSGFQESMIDPMIYGMILNQDSFDNLMELREMVEAWTRCAASSAAMARTRWSAFSPWTTSSTTWCPRWERTPWPTRSAGWCAP